MTHLVSKPVANGTLGSELAGEYTYVVEQNHQGEELWVGVAAVSYGYDLRGNLIHKQDDFDYWWWWDHHWSSDDKMTRVAYGRYSDVPDHVVQYKYDLLGRRVAKKLDSGNWRWYFYDGLKVLAEGSGTSDKSYYTLSPGAIGGIISRDYNGTKLWYHFL